ncbi:hypothetical protein [Chryseolinea sp. H1M3-3]|uniref:hypothetical protein n=1 Tax=Chryseolinea sp. H1M3-3 TaxID=3034144 RepID=UPI0023EC1C3B|nr:hypothetical protein [Chryseolinea sp. H1M3-3]
MQKEELSNLICTLTINGFHLGKVERLTPDNVIVNCHKYDKLGGRVNYSILLSEDKAESASCDSLWRMESNGENSKAILINDYFASARFDSYTKARFFDTLGGMVNTGLILIPNLSEILNQLGHNVLPLGLIGKPDDLHELYVKECLQFIMASPVRRYGIDRAFQKLPDGVVLGKERILIPIDSKAYSNGYSISADDIKRFAFYCTDFRQRYSHDYGPVYSFLVITGTLSDSGESISNRSNELYNECNVKLNCIESKVLGLMVEALKNEPHLKSALNWKNIFLKPTIELKQFEIELDRIRKDKIL